MMDPIVEQLRELWNLWDIRVLVLLSLILQIILFVFATFALGNLSRAKRNHSVENSNNILAGTWASLLLLHLGGPDTITAYSLEDNQLWLRHMFGLSFVAGIIKYGERLWVLRSASNDKSGGIMPFGNDLVVVIHNGRTIGEDKYVGALVMAKKLVKEFKRYMENYDTGRFLFKLPSNQSSNRMQWKDKFTSDDTYFWDALEVETGLMYDLFYTKASITYTKGGGFMRLISFSFEHMKGEWVIQLRQKFPKCYQKKKWSKKVGQFDLLGFCFKEDKPTKFSCILGLFGFEDKFNRYMDLTCVDVPLNLYSTVLDYFYYWSIPTVAKLDQVAQASLISTVKVLDSHLPAFYELIIIFHLATEICYHLKLNDISQQGVNSFGHDDQIKETCKTLSHYMMYLLLVCPSALPIALSDTELVDLIHVLKVFLKDGRNVKEVC
ncbi:hypothetical protein TEA_010196 [Camellia sinensis var. sinensis]|uniref:DUF4220 domain-containing protein n=1 Tax=Camellia sinensis var. sinensis TaxID=542762 RepID=A0A4S4DUC0_CAMSN|nr:hypothetical protein TEA_010196 [Camellia sinensis var. sinensis]